MVALITKFRIVVSVVATLGIACWMLGRDGPERVPKSRCGTWPAVTRPGAANAMFEAGQFVEAAREYRRIVKYDTQDGGAWTRLALCYEAARRPEAAIRCYEHARAGNEFALWRMAILHTEIGRLDAAVPIYEELIRLRPDDPLPAELLRSLREEMARR